MASSFVTVQARGTLALPADVRRRYHLDEPGAQVEVVERDGVIELHPHVPVPADQQWFWTERWQTREHEVDAHAAADEVTTHESAEDFMTHLEKLQGE
ncbi:MAG: AbrB/MazE/SpoVT family DNA-binding domain-containing protein [Patulibacter sp.]|nr:AbrB/MazE/SpoVT family DNA-binding domain-containing protein [Patulibacter sp.]